MYRVQQQPGVRPQLYIQTDLPNPPLFNFYGAHPHRWSKEDVRQWLEWCVEEYALEGVQVDKFACMNGKALCMLTKRNFADRAKNVGDVLFNTLQQRLVAATSPDAVLLPHSAFYPGPLSPSQHGRRNSYDGRTPAVALPAAEHDYSAQSPLAAASPPLLKPFLTFGRQVSMSARPYQSAYRPFSRSPSPGGCECPINLTTSNPGKHSPGRDATHKATREATREATHEATRKSSPNSQQQPSPRHSLTIPTTFAGRLTPSPPELSPHVGGYESRLHRQVSDGGNTHVQHMGSRSPGRRPSPSFGIPEPAHKVQKMSPGSHGMSSPLFSPSYVSGAHPFRDGLPEGFHDIQNRLAITRLDSREDVLITRHYDTIPGSPQPQIAYFNPSLLDGRQLELISDPEEGTGSDLSMMSGSESPVEDETSGVLRNEENQCGSQRGGQHGGHVSHVGHPQQQRNTTQLTHANHNLQIPVPVKTAEISDDFYNPDKQDNEMGQGDTKLLWEFIYQLLRSPDHSALLRWEDEERLVFRILNPSKLAYLWGLQKSRENMTYEKLSRALRYYYRMNIIVKEPHRRLTYRFVKPPEHIQRGQKGAKPGVAHKRRNSSSSPNEAPTLAFCAMPMASSPSISGGAMRRNADTPGITTGIVFKQEVGTTTIDTVNSNNTPVFQTNIHFGSVVKPTYLHQTTNRQMSVPETCDARHEAVPASGSVSSGLILKRHDETELRTHSAVNSGQQDAQFNIPMATEHVVCPPPLEICENLVIKRESPLLSTTNNNTESKDHELTPGSTGTMSGAIDVGTGSSP